MVDFPAPLDPSNPYIPPPGNLEANVSYGPLDAVTMWQMFDFYNWLFHKLVIKINIVYNNVYKLYKKTFQKQFSVIQKSTLWNF